MAKFYITFGQVHTHSVNGKTFDKDCICEIEAMSNGEAHSKAMHCFDGVFHQCVDESRVDEEFLNFFPRGIIPLEE